MVFYLKFCFIFVFVLIGVHGVKRLSPPSAEWSCKDRCGGRFFSELYFVWPQKQTTYNSSSETTKDGSIPRYFDKKEAAGGYKPAVCRGLDAYNWTTAVSGDDSEFLSSSSAPLTLEQLTPQVKPREITSYRSLCTRILSSLPPSAWSLPPFQPSASSASSNFPPSLLSLRSNVIIRNSGKKTKLSKNRTRSWPKGNSGTQIFVQENSVSLCVYRSCYCDNLCSFYGDCCFDYQQECGNVRPTEGAAVNENSSDRFSFQNTNVTTDDVKLLGYMNCVPLPSGHGLHILMVSRCDNTTQSRIQQKLLCEDNTSNQTLLTFPAVLKSSLNIIFKNVFCAFCNGYQLTELETRAFFYNCDKTTSGSSSQAEIEQAIEANQCVLQIKDLQSSPVLRPCTPTQDLSSSPYYWPLHWGNSSSSLLAEVDKMSLHQGKSQSDFNSSEEQKDIGNYKQIPFKHVKAICEKPSMVMKDISDLLQQNPPGMVRDDYRTSPPPSGAIFVSFYPNEKGPAFPSVESFQVFFEISENSWSYDISGTKVIPEVTKCPVDQVYVIYYASCQPLVCPPEMYPFEGQCLLRESMLADKSLLLFPNGINLLFLSVVIEIPSFPHHQVLEVAENITLTFQRALKRRMNVNQSTTIESYPTYNFHPTNKTAGAVTFQVEFSNTSVYTMLDAVKFALNYSIDSLSEDDVKIVEVLISNINISGWNGSGCNTGVLSFKSQKVSLETDGSGQYFIHRMSTFYPLEGVGFSLKLSPPMEAMTLVQSALCVLDTPDMPPCFSSGAIMLTNASYFLKNQTLVVSSSGDRYDSDKFVVRANGTALVCYNSSNLGDKYLLFFKFCSGANQIASLVCLLVSITSLVCVLLTYLLLSQLRNVPGKIVMSLSVSMMTMQGLMLLVKLPDGWLCLSVAWVLHWSMLSTFLWNSALLFDVAFVLRSKSVGSWSKGSRGRALRSYVIVCWLIPMFLVLSLAVMDHYDVYQVGYGAKGQCYLGRQSGVLWLVIVPIVGTLLFNIVCFACALVTLLQSAKLVREATSSSQKANNSGNKRRVIVYIRLSLIMGLTWVVGIGAAFLDLEGLWIVHIVLNASQGLYLLLCFVLKRRVWFMLRDRFSSCRQTFNDRSFATPKKSMILSHITMET